MGSRSKSSNTTTNNVTNYSLQGMENAETVVAGNGNTVTTTDHGAVEGAFAFGSDALGFAENALEIGGEVIAGNTAVSKLAIDSNSDLAKDALKQGFSFGETAIESNNEALKTGFGFAETLVQQNTANSANTMLAIKDLAKSVSTAGASDVANQSLKTVYTIGGVVVAVVLGALLIKGGK